MNGPNSSAPIETEPTPPAYKNRSCGLIVFGVLNILLGALSGLMVPVMLLGQAINARNPNAPPASLAMLLPGLLIYAGLAVALIWLGIGSIKVRRWARALLLIFAWSWLVIGVITMAVMIVVFPKMVATAELDAFCSPPSSTAPSKENYWSYRSKRQMRQ